MKLKIIKSSDGSHTLYREDINETYHSIHGAIQEAKHVFIKNGLHELIKQKNRIRILEVGFGTGLNAYITYLESLNGLQEIYYTGLEAYPVSTEVADRLNYIDSLGECETETEMFAAMHRVAWNEMIPLTNNFFLHKVERKIEDFLSEEPFDLVYYDAFGPNAQEEMWDKKIFAKIYKMMSPDAIFVTYCAKGQVRRDLIEAGFQVHRLPGPPGKREMLRAVKKEL